MFARPDRNQLDPLALLIAEDICRQYFFSIASVSGIFLKLLPCIVQRYKQFLYPLSKRDMSNIGGGVPLILLILLYYLFLRDYVTEITRPVCLEVNNING